MFVDEKAWGEPHLPKKPDDLPCRYPISICLSLSVALFCYNAWLDNVILAETALAELWLSVGNLALALAAAIGLAAWIRTWALRALGKIDPPL